jgi:hypothetical protein
MTNNFFYTELEYTDTNLKEISAISDEWIDLKGLGIDKVYFSGNYPAILFKEIKNFNAETLSTIADIQHKAWNYRKVLFLFVVAPTEIRIYNCSEKPVYISGNLDFVSEKISKIEFFSCRKDDFDSLIILKDLFSRIAVDSGTLWVTDNPLREKINIQQRIDRYLVQSLIITARELKKIGLKDNTIIHSLLMRSLFILYLEDKGAAKETSLYSSIKKGASGYFDILEDVYATYVLFSKLEEHFNGNVFPVQPHEKKLVHIEHLQLIKKCFTDGDLSCDPKLFEGWRLFRFDVIQIELLSEVYENFLTEFEKDPKREKGQFYTPSSLVELILNQKLKTSGETKYQVKILDPACGSGVFLVESYKRLVRRWQNANPEHKLSFCDLVLILKDNIFGIEIDTFALRVTAFSLYLAIVEFLDPKTLWISPDYKFPYLIKDENDKSIKKQGQNLLKADTIGEVNATDFGNFDLVIGNPPFGTKKLLPSIKKYCSDNGFAQEMVLPFLHKAAEFAPMGEIALIFNTKVLTNTEGPFQQFRYWLFNENYVEKIYNFSIFRKTPKSFGGQLFTSAVGPVSIIFYKKQQPKVVNDTIEYWAPKTYIKANLVEGVIIDATDIKYLPREECLKPDTKIWKIAQWGSMEDYKFIKRLINRSYKLNNFNIKYKIEHGVGFQLLTSPKDKPRPDNTLAKSSYLDANYIQRYYTAKNKFSDINSAIKTKKAIDFYLNYYKKNSLSNLPRLNIFRRLGKKEAYNSPHAVLKKGLENKFVCASYLSEDCSFRDGVYGFYTSSENKDYLKTMVAFLNSKLSNYYLFLSISSYGIEREQIMLNEYLEMPFADFDENDHKQIINNINLIINNKIELSSTVLNNFFDEGIEKIIIDNFKLTQKEINLIEDTININLDLFHKGEKSIAFNRVLPNESLLYAEMLCKELNDFLATNNLKINATIYDTQLYDPLNLIKLTFSDKTESIQQQPLLDMQNTLKQLDQYTMEKEAQSIYLQKQLKYFDKDKIYLIKPNQKRFWTRSQALSDAKDLVIEIVNM